MLGAQIIIHTIVILLDLVYCTICTLTENNLDIYTEQYGEGYGTEWIHFPDDDGVLHRINLTVIEDEEFSLSSSASQTVECRLHNCNDTTYILLDVDGRAINESEQDNTNEIMRSKLSLKLITHGWRSSADTTGVLNIKNAYLEGYNINVITVDWSAFASSLLYHRVASQTKDIGTAVASFLDGLYYEYNVTGDQVHLIGHSLGAYVMGIAGFKANRTVYRVTGLDPARPFFEFPPQCAFEKLNSSDAEIVDVIHTCAGLLGFKEAIGTVDFFPNGGGAPQPGCENIFKYFDACSHSISFHYFFESIKDPSTYPAYECPSWQDFVELRCNNTGYMGEGVDKNMTGTYYNGSCLTYAIVGFQLMGRALFCGRRLRSHKEIPG